MQLETARFGTTDVDEKSILFFENGIFGFEQLKRFIVIECEQTEPIQWLQAIDDMDISLPIVNPFLVKSDYEIEVENDELSEIGTQNENEMIAFNVLVIPQDIPKLTINLAAPILINVTNNRGKQIIMETKIDNAIRYPAFEGLKHYFKES